MKKLLQFVFILLISGHAFSQKDGNTITLTGIVLKMDSIVPVANVNIFHKSTHLGVHSNEHGLFSIEVGKHDTIVFNAVGYQTTFYVVPDTLHQSRYSIIQHMPPNNILLETVEIISWPSLEQFNHHFTKEHGYDESILHAKQNVNPSLKDMNRVVSNMDADANYRIEGMRYQNRYSYVYENAHISVNKLMNPKRWNEMVEDLKKGSY